MFDCFVMLVRKYSLMSAYFRAMFLAIKNRINTLNIIRLVVGISFIGEGLHSENIVFGLVGAVFLVQILFNKKCAAEGCEVDSK